MLKDKFSSSFARKVWVLIYRAFPKFSLRHSPFKFISGFGVLWSQGYGRLAYIGGDRVLSIHWSLGDGENCDRIFHLSEIVAWDESDNGAEISESFRNDLRLVLERIYANEKGEKLKFT